MSPPFVPQIRLYQNWLAAERGLRFADYPALHNWSVTDLSAFWQSIWDYFDVQSPTPHSAVLSQPVMPGAKWFTGARVNYAAHVFRHVAPADAAGLPAIISHNEASLASGIAAVEMSWPELQRRVASLALHLQAHGVQSGDRVAAYLPNIPEAMVAFLAVASIGAVWSICAPDMGTAAVLDRFKQIEPTALIACASATYGGRTQERISVVLALLNALPSVRHVVMQGATAADIQQIESRKLTLGDSNLVKQKMAASTVNGSDAGELNTADARAAKPPAEVLPAGNLLAAHVPSPDLSAIISVAACARFDWATDRNDAQTSAFKPAWLPFDHPLWIVYSSGTTGLPKAIVHGHGGVMVVALANKVLHNDVGCSYAANSFGERFHWYSSTGWVMWNAQLSGLLNGTTCVIFDGSPGAVKPAGATGGEARPTSPTSPDWTTLWRFAAQTRVTFFGAGAAFFASCMKAGVNLSACTDLPGCGDLSAVRALGSTGSPLSLVAQQWGVDQFASIGTPDIWFCNISGGTDFAGAFIGGNRELPQVPGEMQCRLLGCAVQAWNEAGESVVDEVGELVCSQPIPSMPLYLWGDVNNARYMSSYFDMYPSHENGSGRAAVWRHGDWLKVTATGSCIIYGRSDATINRYGLRMGTSELYSAVEALPEVVDSLVVDLEYLGRDSYLPLFVVLKPGVTLDAVVKAKINNAIKTALSPRFVPNDIFAVPDVPRTLSGKKQELPIKKLLLGAPLEKVVNKEAMANPGCLQWYVDFAAARALQSA